jgi:hypothetical protein
MVVRRVRVDRAYLIDILSTSGFTATENNVDALALLVGKMLLAGVYSPLSRADRQMAARYLEDNQWDGRKAARWPSLIYSYLETMVKIDRSYGFLGPGVCQSRGRCLAR